MSSVNDKKLRETALVFYKDDIEAIESILDAFLKKSAVRCALLVDKDGHMITGRGETKHVDLDTISALVAGSFAATKALAEKLGENDFTALFHQGRSGNIQLSLVGDRALLTAIFDDTTTIGMVRLYAAEAAKRLSQIFKRKQGNVRPGADPLGGKEFTAGTADALDGVFGK
jgi:predicted regulator of Ras-like GTPase activity (Roadblock/LC7/MglB family)